MNLYNLKLLLGRLSEEVADTTTKVDRLSTVPSQNRASLQEVVADLNWATIAIRRALQTLVKSDRE